METTKATQSRSTQVEETRTVESRPVADSRFFLYRATIKRRTTTQVPGRAEKVVPQTIVSEGVATKDALTTWLTTAQVAVAAPTLKRGDSQSQVCAVPPASIEALRLYGWHQQDRKSGIYAKDFFHKTPLTAVEKGEPVEVIEVYGSNHEAFRLDGTPLPCCRFFGAYPGHMDATRYDLDKVVEILSKRPDIRFSKPSDLDRRWSDKKGSVIFAGRHGPECIVFDWIPDAATFQKVLDRAKEVEPAGVGSDRFYVACFDLDIFALRAGGAAKHDTYWKADKEPESSLDDD